MEKLSMRDAFFNRLYELAKRDRNILVVSADMGAPSLDKFRRDLKEQFINVGIAEHNMVALAAGLALSGKKVFTYAIMPFVTARCYEMIKVDFSLMNLPVTTVGVGAGFSYDDSGPTHHSTEDLTIMRALPNMTLLNSSDSVMAGEFAEMACRLSGPSYVRLDRELLPVLYSRAEDFSAGLSVRKKGKDLWLLATGNMVHRALEVSEELARHSLEAAVVDLYRIKPFPAEVLCRLIGPAKGIITLEEHLLAGGLGSAVAEVLMDGGKMIPLKRIGIQDRYYYAYGGRDHIQEVCGLDRNTIAQTVLDWTRQMGLGMGRPVSLGKEKGEMGVSHA